MERDTTTTADDLDRPEGNSLVENYQKHDIGHRETVERLDERDCEVVDWGIDMRHDDGDDGIIYDDKMDLKVLMDGEVIALIDVKTKGSPSYMGQFNERHYVKYHGHAESFDVPTFVVMYHVDYESDTIYDSFVFEVGSDDLYENVHVASDSGAVSRFPDGNDAVLVPHKHRRGWSYLEIKIEEQYMEALYQRDDT